MHPLRLYCTLLCLCLWLWQCRGRSLLVLGDSVDRFMTQEWCEMRTGRSASDLCSAREGNRDCYHWMGDVLRHEVYPASMTNMLCNISTTGDTIAFVHIYGSPDAGPYFRFGLGNSSSNITLSRNDSYTDSPERIAVTLNNYFNLMNGSPPDLVVLNTALWDIAYMYEAQGLINSTLKETDKGYLTRHGDLDKVLSQSFNASCEKFATDMRNRIRDVERGLSLHMGLDDGPASLHRARSHIALRTSVWSSANNILTHAFNNITRELAEQLQLSLYDYDGDLWSGLAYSYNTSAEKELLRDFIHPQRHYTAAAGEKMLMLAYSSSFIRRCGGEACLTPSPRPWWRGNGSMRPATVMRVLIVAEKRSNGGGPVIDHRRTFYVKSDLLSREVLERFGGVSKHFMRAMHLSPSDVLYLPAAALATINRGPPLPIDLLREMSGINRTSPSLSESLHRWAASH